MFIRIQADRLCNEEGASMTEKQQLDIVNVLAGNFDDKDLNPSGVPMPGTKKYEILNNVNTFSPIWDADLQFLNFDTARWHVQDYVPEGGIVLFAGKRAAFKSWAALEMAVCMAAGRPLFGKFPCETSPYVLYIDEENGLRVVKQRIDTIKKGLNISVPLEKMCILSGEGFRFDVPGSVAWLESFLEKHSPCVIFVDTFRRTHSADDNDATETNAILHDIVKGLASKYGATFVLLHHMRKGNGKEPNDLMDEMRGSSEVANIADVVLINSKPSRTNDRFVFHQAKCRGAGEQMPQTIELAWSEDGSALTFNCLGDAVELMNSVDVCASKIMEWTAEENKIEFATKEAIAHCKGRFTRPCVERALPVLLNQGRLLKQAHGKYRVPADLEASAVSEQNKAGAVWPPLAAPAHASEVKS